MKKSLILLLFILTTLSSLGQSSNQDALFSAIRDNNLALITSVLQLDSQLINAPMHVDQFMSDVKKYPIHEALKMSNRETISHLLTLGADPTKNLYRSAILSGTNTSSLEILVEYRELKLIKQFIHQLKPGIEAYTAALEWSANNQEEEKVRFLLIQGEKILLGG